MITAARAAASNLDWVLAGGLAGTVKIHYHKGNLARDKRADKDLADIADRMLKLSDGRFDVVSRCGHVRGEIVGQGRIRLIQQRRESGQTAYVAVKP